MDKKYIEPQVNTVGLVAHYKLWAGLTSAASVFDYSLNGNDGTITASNIVPAYPGFTFAATANDRIDIGTLGDFGSELATKKPSFSMWLKSSVTGSIISPAGFINAGVKTIITIRLNLGTAGNTGHIRVSMRDDDGNILQGEVRSNTGITDGSWHHLATGIDGPGDIVTIYVDGVAQSVTQATTQTPDNFSNLDVTFLIGATHAQTVIDEEFDGSIDDFMIFNKILTATEAKNIYEVSRWRYSI